MCYKRLSETQEIPVELRVSPPIINSALARCEQASGQWVLGLHGVDASLARKIHRWVRFPQDPPNHVNPYRV